ncbi:circularly permuted type 2 ATP-grasp protein, partial [Shewanella sp. SG41-4]|nr:circularly permuted type 2 ATP-grasp protein [Shewanella sp. SG41-4]
MAIEWNDYNIANFHDELVQNQGVLRPYAIDLCNYLSSLSDSEIIEYKAAADSAIHVMGITFRVYNDEEGSIDRAWPFDIIPRLI